MSKLMMLVAAKWRQFSDLNPGLGGGSSGVPGGGSEENTNTSVSSEYTKTPRSRREKDKVCYNLRQATLPCVHDHVDAFETIDKQCITDSVMVVFTSSLFFQL